MQGASGIWATSRPDNPSRDNTAGSSSYSTGQNTRTNGLTDAVASTQRPAALDAWPRPSTTWTSTDSPQFRSSASRSTSPPIHLQSIANASPFSNHAAAKSITTPIGSSYSTAPAAYVNYADTAPRTNGPFQQNFKGFQSASQAQPSAYGDAGPQDAFRPASRQFEPESSSQPGMDVNAFAFRHPSRFSLGVLPSSLATQQPISRSQSQSFLPGGQHSQAAMEAVQNQSLRSSLRTDSPGSRTNGAHASTGMLSVWSEYAPIGSGNLQEPRRDSLANSVHHHSSTDSPRFAAQTDPWDTTPTAPQDRIQRQLGSARQGTTQSPYTDVPFQNYVNVNWQAQLLQQHMQMQSLQPSMYSNYGFPSAQNFYAPTAPAGMLPRGRPQDPTVGIRSQELEEFRRSPKSNRKWELKVSLLLARKRRQQYPNTKQTVFGQVVEFAGDQQGSRFLQEKIPTANSDDRQKVFDEIMVNANALMVDVFGNYVIQQLFQHGTMVQKKMLAAKMKDNVVQLSMQLYGCRCVQEVSIPAHSSQCLFC